MRQFRYFFYFLKAQENYLNRMARKGYRLTNTHIASYEFEKTNQAIRYEVVYIADRNADSYHSFRAMLDELQYTYFFKNLNLNYAVGKAKLRFTGHGFHMQTTKDLINRELLIIEKPETEKSFLYTSVEDWIYYYQGVRNVLLQYIIVCFLLTTLLFFQEAYGVSIFFLLATLLSSIFTLLAQRTLRNYKQDGMLYE